MLAKRMQHQLLFRLSAAVPSVTERYSATEYILYFGSLIGFNCQAEKCKIPAQQQAVNVGGN
jgi:hypothetical protein